MPTPTRQRRALQHLAVWLLVLPLGALLLRGRYDFGGAGGAAARAGYWTSLYLSSWTTVVAYYVIRDIVRRPRLARVMAAILFFFLTLPHRWLGLDGLRRPTRIFNLVPRTPMVWFPAALLHRTFPHDLALFTALALPLALAAWWVSRSGARSWVKLAAAAWLVILFQIWLHASMRSPYSYTQYFEDGSWPSKALFPDGSGVVNGDVAFFTGLNDLFNGYPTGVDTMLVRRSYIHYLASHFTYFFNPYFVFIVLNAALWMLAVACGYSWAKRVTQDEPTARLFAALVAVGNGFIYFAAQPMHYLASYAVIVIALYLFEVCIVERGLPWLFAACFGLCSLVYDLFPLYLGLLAYAFYRKASVRDTAGALLVSFGVFAGFLAVVYRIAHLPNADYNAQLAISAFPPLLALLRHPSLDRWYLDSVGLLHVLVQNLLFAFFFFETVGAGVVFVLDTQVRRLALILLLPMLLLNAYLFLGKVPWGNNLLIELPRLSYIAYPAVYLLAAVGLRRAPARMAWSVVAAIFLWHNFDVLGFPEMHFHFYFPNRLFFARP